MIQGADDAPILVELLQPASYSGRRANSGAAWQPSCQKLSELAEIIG